MGISSCRAIDRVVAACQGRAVTVTGSGPRVVPGWGKGGPVNVVLSGSGGDGTNGDGRGQSDLVLCLLALGRQIVMQPKESGRVACSRKRRRVS